MAEEIIFTFPKETLKRIERKMEEEGISNTSLFLDELLTRSLTRHMSTRAWEEVIRRIITDCMHEEEGTILIYSSDTEDADTREP